MAKIQDMTDEQLEAQALEIELQKMERAKKGLPENKAKFKTAFDTAHAIYKRIKQVDKDFVAPNFTTGAAAGRKERIDNAIKASLPSTIDDLIINLNGKFDSAAIKTELATVFKDGKPKYSKDAATGVWTANKATRKN